MELYHTNEYVYFFRKNACVVSLKTRYTNMYVPSDFFNATFPWHESFPLTRPFQLGKNCTFHVLHKDVERLGVGQNTAVLDPPDADHLYSAKVGLRRFIALDLRGYPHDIFLISP